ncbi:MAG: hypothetical protein MUC83_16760 [Pirellula sp.]|nr:hypothetical protein [Pirellula sp.]
MQPTDVQPIDYGDALTAALNSWWYVLTFLLPAAVYAIPAVKRWRYILWLVPIAFLASCIGYFVYWRSIDYALMDYYHRTGYFNTADTWYVFMPFFRGLPNALFATFVCTVVGWFISRRRGHAPDTSLANCEQEGRHDVPNESENPYDPPRTIRQGG